MSDAYQDLRNRARALALATLFDKPAHRDVACDLLQLGLELEKIIELASEPMLAMIRMQWWVDLFDNEIVATEVPDFAKRLHQCTNVTKDDLNLILHNTQDSLQSPQPSVAWDDVFFIIAKGNGWQIDGAVMRQLGHNFAALYQEEGAHNHKAVTDKSIRQASDGTYGFPRLVNLLVERQLSGKPNQDFLLIFRYLMRVLF